MKILVLCTGNSCRSQIAEAILQKELGENGVVYSAGISPQGVNPNAINVMAEIGIDISQNSSNSIDDFNDIDFDYILTVCANADQNCPIFPGKGQKTHIPFDDPADAVGTEDEILSEFRQVRDEIQKQLIPWVNSL